MCTSPESRLKSQTESSSTNFPFGAEWNPERVFAMELLGRQLAIDFRLEKSRSIMSSRVRLEADANIPLHPDGAILYRENSSQNVVPSSLPRIHRYIKITRRHADTVQTLLALLIPFPSSHNKGGIDAWGTKPLSY